jgi:hypothetical protein
MGKRRGEAMIEAFVFERGLHVYVERTKGTKRPLFFACAFCVPITQKQDAIKLHYQTPLSIIYKIETGGRYNTHYWLTLRDMLHDIKRISGYKHLFTIHLINGAQITRGVKE